VGAGEAIDSNRPTEVCGQRLQIERAITNLLDNAVKFDAFDSAIDVTLDGGTVTVRDRGPGIPPGEMKLIFERFHRSIASRSLPGSGLGLAIVADVARRHSGSYFARNHPEGGAEVGMTLPLANAGD
jgi:two-component system sensor histidine kinase MprB